MVAAAERNALLIGKRHDVVGVGAGQAEADQPAPFARRTEQADSRDCREAGVCVAREPPVVRGDRGSADGVQVIHRCVQAHGAGDVGRSCLEFVRHLVPGAFLVVHRGDHFAAALERIHLFEQRAAAVEHADARWTGHLVPRKGKEVAAQGLDVHWEVTGALGRIHEGDHALATGART